MESHDSLKSYGHPDFGTVVHTLEPADNPSVIVVCEHASRRIPEGLGDMGLSQDARRSHIAWDPGALPVAQAIARGMSAAMVYGGVSRLVYDCNRPPEASDAMPVKSEDFVIPGNTHLTDRERKTRIDKVYSPFRSALTGILERYRDTLELMVTIHSFTPVYRGQNRSVELGLLHGKDDRFALGMMNTAAPDLALITRLNEPYSAADGVAHTLDLHAAPRGLLNVMIEIRNDLIQTHEEQQAMAGTLVPWMGRTRNTIRGAAS
ncbi:Predicted N-formylglutamate amidohydrolase [Ruegeria halocynthiae]|uniref:Predicted N-formylglutamate amidohydrolase n=1 Tax=Ruegeria halocynthiae TaxID=985054 RepID=A0A1H2US45_9RHOB|nr:N-formylglutamate amidohydrolase [Ruegeria halocynthiae]SDW58963.1 Predicted N-formylglutamate amidohydrolase [Ruegeria halocynthiae]